MSLEINKHLSLLESKSTADLNARSDSLAKAIKDTNTLFDTIPTSEYGTLNPKFDVRDPMATNYMSNSVRVGSVRKNLAEITLPALRKLKKLTDDALIDKIRKRATAQFRALQPLSSPEKQKFLDFLEDEQSRLQELQSQGYLQSEIPVRIAETRIDIVKNETQDNAAVTEIKAEPTKEPVKTTKTEKVQKGDEVPLTLSNGTKLEVTDPFKRKILAGLFSGNFDKSDLAEQLLGENNPQNRDIIDMWLQKISLEDLRAKGYSIVEIPLKNGKTIITALEEEKINEQIAEIQQTTNGTAKPETTDHSAFVPQEEIPEAKYATMEYILTSPTVTRQLIVDQFGTNKIGRKFGWTSAQRSLKATSSKITSRVGRGEASERELAIFELMQKYAPAGSTPNQVGRCFGREIIRILQQNEEGSFITRSTEPIENVGQQQDILIETDELILPIELERDQTVTLEEPQPSEFKSGIADLAKSILSSGIALSEEMSKLVVAIAEETDKTGKEPQTQLIERVKTVISDDESMMEFIGSFDDDRIHELLFWIVDHKDEVFDKLLPENGVDEENINFEIGPNGAIIFETQEEETQHLTILETQIPDIRDIIKKRLQEVVSKITPTTSLNYFQIQGIFREIGLRDIRMTVKSRFVKPGRAADGRENFNSEQIAIMLVLKDLKKVNFSNRMKKDLEHLISEEAHKLEEEQAENSNK